MWLSTRDVPGHWHNLLLYSVLNVISPVWSLPYFISGTSTHQVVHSESSIPIVIQVEPNIPSFGAYWFFFLLHRISREVILICENLMMVSKFPRVQRSPRIGGHFLTLWRQAIFDPNIFFIWPLVDLMCFLESHCMLFYPLKAKL